MKYIKYLLIVLVVGSLTSCLKSKNDFAGLRLDNGNIVTTIAEAAYINTDGQNLGCGFSIHTNFNFSALPNESVKFFTLHVAQPRNVKIQGAMQVKVIMTALDPSAGYDDPTAAITVPATITIPAFTGTSMDFPVKFTVDKTLLDPSLHYAVNFTIASVSQGVYSELDKSVDVIINALADYNESSISGVYTWEYSLVDDKNQFVANNKKSVFVEEDAPGDCSLVDALIWSCTSSTSYPALYANNTITGANTIIMYPEYLFDAGGNVTDVLDWSGSTAVSAIVVDPAGCNPFVYTDNDHRAFKVKYSFTLTTTLNGVPTSRNVTVNEKFTYNTAPQALYAF